ncbi:OmpA family protein [Mariniflexile gromovii]|uniref:OmpA family protein n=1 Tax=Mariniflexile gromovii TaxID=362523 RepID=A0ABS4BWX7_9FLAO|nr:OmpA family protein [Mariniflexile gromovii]MBP0905093.1 OmpA family protein [Mariniflexile gromovii]
MKNYILLIFVSICSLTLNAQRNNAADKLYRNFAYMDAAKLYKQALEKQDSSAYLLTRIGDCYYKNSDSKEAVKWYSLAAKKGEGITPKFMFKYIQTLRSVGNNKLAEEWLVRFKNYTPADSIISNEKYSNVTTNQNNRPQLKLINLSTNTSLADFGGFEDSSGNFYFSSAMNKEALSENKKKQIYSWNEEPYLKIYKMKVKKILNSIEVGDFEPIASDSISSVSNHQGTLTITKDGKTLYFTGNNVKKNEKAVYDKKGTNNLKIYRASLIDGKWSHIEDLSINDKNYSTGHPTLSPDEKSLYFVSDKEGGFGQSDLYVVAINSDGTLGEAQNLGPKINTPGREMFPFIAADSSMYFSSDGYIENSFGLLDIYKTNLVKDGLSSLVTIENMGADFNSGYDDFAFFTNDGEQSGYLSSNRENGQGSDDIYAFLTEKCMQSIVGIVYDVLTKEPVKEVKVILMDKDGVKLSTTISNQDGMYMFEDVDCETDFIVTASKPRHESTTEKLTTTNIPNDKINADLYLRPNDININPIYFDYNKSNIRPNAALELDKVVAVLKEYPKMIIKIESHTDSRGDDSYNLALSDRRAKSTKEYILSKGIMPMQIESAIGYGETQLVNRCVNGFRNICSDKEHEENRRSLFIIVNFKTFDK